VLQLVACCHEIASHQQLPGLGLQQQQRQQQQAVVSVLL
jgi:hypothetical protein